jgi:hypothetical protein
MSRELLLTSLTSFYTNHSEHSDAIASIIAGSSKLSLRILDWFVTHYARTNQVIYYIDSVKHVLLDEYPKNGGGAHIRKFNLYLEYRKQLQSYTKMFFDPFRRHERISFIIDKDSYKVIETTVGQLNFFRWAMEHHVIEYVLKNIDRIEKHMALMTKQQKHSVIQQKAEVPNMLTHGPCHVVFN